MGPQPSCHELAEGCFASFNSCYKVFHMSFQHRDKQKQDSPAAVELIVPQQLKTSAQLAEASSLALATHSAPITTPNYSEAQLPKKRKHTKIAPLTDVPCIAISGSMITDESRGCFYPHPHPQAEEETVVSIRNLEAINLRTFLSAWRMPLHWFLLLMYRADSKHTASMPRFHFWISLSFPACSVLHIRWPGMGRGRAKGKDEERRINVVGVGFFFVDRACLVTHMELPPTCARIWNSQHHSSFWLHFNVTMMRGALT